MCVEKKHGAALVFQVENNVADFAAADGIEAGHGLVQKDHFGIMQDCLCDSRALEHTFGEFSQLNVGRRW